MMQVIFSKIELETPPFLTVIQFYSNIDKKRVGKNPTRNFNVANIQKYTY